MKIAFFGTPDFAVPSLRALTGEGFEVVAVITQPDRPRNRSRSTLVPPPVRVVADSEGLPTLQPVDPNSPEFIDELKSYQPDIGVVVAYGHILKPALLELPPRGMINVHASLLPELRGAAPIQYAIMREMDETGISIIQMDAGMDSGPILHQVSTEIAPDETGGELAVNLAEVGALALVQALAYLASDTISTAPQDDSKATFAPKIDRETARIDWNESTSAVAARIRAMDPVPGAWSTVGERSFKLFGATCELEKPAEAPGTVVSISPLRVATSDGIVSLQYAQPEGRNRMPTTDWCCGSGPDAGAKLT